MVAGASHPDGCLTRFTTSALPAQHDVLAPDGSEVRILLSLHGGSMAHFQLPAGQASCAVRHRTVEEIWYVLNGTGEMWRSCEGAEEITPLTAGLCLTIPLGTSFQFRAGPDGPLAAVAITMPPWPQTGGEHEAEMVSGAWEPLLR